MNVTFLNKPNPDIVADIIGKILSDRYGVEIKAKFTDKEERKENDSI